MKPGNHPGGKAPILALCGKDATEAFNAVSSHIAAGKVPKGTRFSVGPLVDVAGCESTNDAGDAVPTDEKTRRCHAVALETDGDGREALVLQGVGDRAACEERNTLI